MGNGLEKRSLAVCNEHRSLITRILFCLSILEGPRESLLMVHSCWRDNDSA